MVGGTVADHLTSYCFPLTAFCFLAAAPSLTVGFLLTAYCYRFARGAAPSGISNQLPSCFRNARGRLIGKLRANAGLFFRKRSVVARSPVATRQPPFSLMRYCCTTSLTSPSIGFEIRPYITVSTTAMSPETRTAPI